MMLMVREHQQPHNGSVNVLETGVVEQSQPAVAEELSLDGSLSFSSVSVQFANSRRSDTTRPRTGISWQ